MPAPRRAEPGGRDPDEPAVIVVGGYEYSSGMNQPATVTVRELARSYRVLNVHSDAHGSILGRLQGRASHMDARDTARTLFGTMRPRRVEERLWLVPVRGLAALGPLSFPEGMRRRNVRLIGRLINGWRRETGALRCVLLFYWWSLPELVEYVPHIASLYDCTDDFTAIPGRLVPSRVVARLENQLLDAVDRSYVVSAALLDGRAGVGRRVSVLPNGFDLRLFGALEQAGFPVPASVRQLERPIVGYAGGLTSRLDWDLLAELARRRPDWTFLLAGGEPSAAPAAVRVHPNVVFQSALPYPEALGLISRFDVATIPVRIAQFSRGNSFLKLLDYFAHGKPVVAPPLPDTEAVARAHPGLVTLADGADAWETALAAGLEEPTDSPLRDGRRAYAAERTVEQRVARMMAEALSEHQQPPAGG